MPGEASCAAGVTCRSGVPRRAGWRQPGEGCARSRRRPALRSPADNSLQKSYTHAVFMSLELLNAAK
jgi:hypothetical protein